MAGKLQTQLVKIQVFQKKNNNKRKPTRKTENPKKTTKTRMHCQQMIKKESKKKSAPRRLLLLWLLLPFLAVFVVVVVAAFICIVLRLNSFRFGLFGSPLSPFSTLPHSSHLANACVCVCVPSMDALCHWLFPLFSTFHCLFATHTPFFGLRRRQQRQQQQKQAAAKNR